MKGPTVAPPDLGTGNGGATTAKADASDSEPGASDSEPGAEGTETDESGTPPSSERSEEAESEEVTSEA